MKTQGWILTLLLMTVCLPMAGQSALNKKEFAKHWVVESESPDYKVTFHGDTADILAPKGLTLWRKEKMTGRVCIEYEACVVVEDGNSLPTNRLSDLNCFWMASDPKYPHDIFKRKGERNGVFTNCYALQLYYMGYGGNHNSTTRFTCCGLTTGTTSNW